MGKSIQDYEKFEEERSDFIKDRLLKYVDVCVGVDERSAQVCVYLNSEVSLCLIRCIYRHTIRFPPPFLSLPPSLWDPSSPLSLNTVPDTCD
jgi:hypothetical protein